MKNIKDYLHLYLGCDVKVPGAVITLTPEVLSTWDFVHHGIKPILRPLNDMSENEENEIEGEYGSYGLSRHHLCEALKSHDLRYVKRLDEAFGLTRYLLSKHFDLFGLIEAGLAIDKTKITQPA